jgi:hypothetical protein
LARIIGAAALWAPALWLSPAAAGQAVPVAARPPDEAPVPRPNPHRPDDRVYVPYGITPPVPPPPRALLQPSCPQVLGGVAGALGPQPGPTYGATYGESYGTGPGSTIAQSSAVLGTPCPPVLDGSQLPGTLDLSGGSPALAPPNAP